MTRAAQDLYTYTNEDVREDAKLYEMALEYIEGYKGDWPPLLEIVRYGDEYGFITVHMARKVLNCMRHDRDVSVALEEYRTLEAAKHPLSPIPQQRRPGGSKRRGPRELQCNDIQSHSMHTWGKDHYHWCDGVPYRINRSYFDVHAKIKVQFASSRTGNLVHRLTGEAWFRWWPEVHGWGFQSYGRSGKSDIWAPELVVDLQCRYPSLIRRPILYKTEPKQLYDASLFGDKAKQRCKHCAWEDVE